MLLFRQAARAESTPYEPGAHQLGYCVHFGTQGPPAREKTHRTVSTPRGTQKTTRASQPRAVYARSSVLKSSFRRYLLVLRKLPEAPIPPGSSPRARRVPPAFVRGGDTRPVKLRLQPLRGGARVERASGKLCARWGGEAPHEARANGAYLSFRRIAPDLDPKSRWAL